MALLFSLSEYGSMFATRPRGGELRQIVLERLARDDAVVIDFDGVSKVSYSFADEFVGKLTSETDGLRIDVINATDRIADTIQRAQKRRLAVTC